MAEVREVAFAGLGDQGTLDEEIPGAVDEIRREDHPRDRSHGHKGRYAFYFPEPGKKDPVEVKATAVKIAHRDFAKGTWLVVEFFPDEREARCYLTNVDCSTREGCRKALSCYRSRWRVEETFRFMKVFYSMEGFMVRNVNAMNWLLLAICSATAFLSSIAASRTPAYWKCKNAFKSFAPDMSDEDMVKAKGHSPWSFTGSLPGPGRYWATARQR